LDFSIAKVGFSIVYEKSCDFELEYYALVESTYKQGKPSRTTLSFLHETRIHESLSSISYGCFH